MLFHISEKNNLEYLTPRIPQTGLAFNEDATTPRICFAPSINCCLRAICMDSLSNSLKTDFYIARNERKIVEDEDFAIIDKMAIDDIAELILKDRLSWLEEDGLTLYPLYHAYVPIDVKYNEVYLPSVDEVFDVKYTHEAWVKHPCKVKKVFSFIVTGSMRIGTFVYTNKKKDLCTGTIDDYSYTIVSDSVAKCLIDMKTKLQCEFMDRVKLEERLISLEKRLGID